MRTLDIDLGNRSYPIHIGAGLLDSHSGGGSLIAERVKRRAMIVSNETVAPLYLDRVIAGMGNIPTAHVVLPDGEAHKTLATLDQVFEALLSEGFDRGGTVIALGGGVIGDMAGFTAASYQRGIDFIQVPTTLLAQVDSSVGGKTGVNHALGKNMIGAIIEAVYRSCEIKARVVEADEREHGQRALLNLGHTFGHAIEAAMGYGRWLHGEAVSAGTAMALDLAVRLNEIDEATRDRGLALLSRAGLPIDAPADMTPEQFLLFMQRDKKVSDGQLRLVIPGPIGRARVGADYDPEALHATLAAFCSPP